MQCKRLAEMVRALRIFAQNNSVPERLNSSGRDPLHLNKIFVYLMGPSFYGGAVNISFATKGENKVSALFEFVI